MPIGRGAGFPGDLLERAHDLKVQGVPFALATVVRAERPSSAKAGMKAIIMRDGTLLGWVGGSCAHPIVVREALALLHEGAPRLIRLSPREGVRVAEEGVVHHRMTCHSGGSLEIYVEPVLPKPQLLLVGEGPLVTTLARLARLEDFAVWIAGDGPEAEDADLRLPLEQFRNRLTSSTYVVVATMGSYDEEALEQLVGAGASYVGLVASRKRAGTVWAYLRGRGRTDEDLGPVKVPAGLDLGAVTPEEIALSIMAEIVQVRRTQSKAASGPQDHEPPLRAAAETAIDPICGMTVEIAVARHTLDHRGVRFYFCSAGCKEAFAQDPTRYVTAEA